MREQDVLGAADICLAALFPLLYAALEKPTFFEGFICTAHHEQAQEKYPFDSDTEFFLEISAKISPNSKKISFFGREISHDGVSATPTEVYLLFLELLRNQHCAIDRDILRIQEEIERDLEAYKAKEKIDCSNSRKKELFAEIERQYSELIPLAHSHSITLLSWGDCIQLPNMQHLIVANRFLTDAVAMLAEKMPIPETRTAEIIRLTKQVTAWCEESRTLRQDITDLTSENNNRLSRLNPHQYNPPDDLKTLLTVLQKIMAEANATQIRALLNYLKERPNFVACVVEHREILVEMAYALFRYASKNPRWALDVIPPYLCPKINLSCDPETEGTQHGRFQQLFNAILENPNNATCKAIELIENLMSGTKKKPQTKKIGITIWRARKNAATTTTAGQSSTEPVMNQTF